MTPTLPPLPETVESIAHRVAWRYKQSGDPHHSDTYTFNRATLLQFAEALRTAHMEAIRPEVLRLADEMVSLNSVAAIFHARCQWDKRDLAARERDAARAALAALMGGAGC